MEICDHDHVTVQTVRFSELVLIISKYVDKHGQVFQIKFVYFILNIIYLKFTKNG